MGIHAVNPERNRLRRRDGIYLQGRIVGRCGSIMAGKKQYQTGKHQKLIGHSKDLKAVKIGNGCVM